MSSKPNYKRISSKEYRELFNEYYDSIRNFLYFKTSDSNLAEDVAQDAFLKLWEIRDKIDLKTVRSWLYTVAGNMAINRLKRQQLQYKFINQADKKSRTNDPQFLMEMDEFQVKLQKVLEKIPEGSREVFLMNRIEGLKYREISERLGIGMKAVEKRMSKALQIIRDNIGYKL